MILQAFDFYKLFEKEKCIATWDQINGATLLMGVDLIRRILKKMPLD